MKKFLVPIILLFSVSAFAQSDPKETEQNSPPKLQGDISINQDNFTVLQDNITVQEKNDNITIDNATSTEQGETPEKQSEYISPYRSDNPGYMKSHGMIGIYGFLPDFHSKSFRDNDIGAGGFIYYNLYNAFWGNVMVGLNADYLTTRVSKGNYNANMTLANPTFNIAYMTASDTVNFWGGGGVTYNILQTEMRYLEGAGGNLHEKFTTTFWSFDTFIGGEYIFTDFSRHKFGVFFEFRYTFTPWKVNLQQNIGGIDFKDTLTFQRMRYTVGFTYHF